MRPGDGSGGGAPPGVLSYLNGVLSARGAAALPYAEELKWPIREHILQLVQARRGRVPATSSKPPGTRGGRGACAARRAR